MVKNTSQLSIIAALVVSCCLFSGFSPFSQDSSLLKLAHHWILEYLVLKRNCLFCSVAAREVHIHPSPDFIKMADQLIGNIFSKIDKDASGTITLVEMDAVFKVFDKDGE